MTPLGNVEPVLRGLRAAGMQLAVVTNDSKEPRRAPPQARLGDLFVAVIGCDSGHGAKPESGGTRWARLFEAAAGARASPAPAPTPHPGVRAAMEAAGVDARSAIMVGDSMRHGGGPLCRGAPSLRHHPTTSSLRPPDCHPRHILRSHRCVFTVAIHTDGAPLPAGGDSRMPPADAR